MKKFIVRDLLILTLVLSLLVVNLESNNLQLMTGIGVGLLIYLLHEWSHYLGAVRSGAHLKRAGSLFSPFIFSFDSNTNSRKQFIDMSWPGFASTFSCLLALYLYRPDEIWAEVAWKAAIALTAFTVVVEGPIFLWAIIKREIPPIEIPLINVNPALRSFNKKLKS